MKQEKVGSREGLGSIWRSDPLSIVVGGMELRIYVDTEYLKGQHVAEILK